MGRTVSLCLFIAMLGYAAATWLTLGFRVWTEEEARRLTVLQAPVAAPEIAMLGPDLDTASMRELLQSGNRVTIADFIYTRCPTLCLTLGTTFQQLQASIREDTDQTPPRIQLLSISFDPTYDTPEALSGYAKRFRADPRFWRLAAPARSEELRPLLDRYGVVVIPDGMGGYEHNAALLVMDASGRLRHIFDYDQGDAAIAFARHLAVEGTAE